MTDTDVGLIMVVVSLAAWIAYWVADYRAHKKMKEHQWQRWPDYDLRSRAVRENRRVPMSAREGGDLCQ